MSFQMFKLQSLRKCLQQIICIMMFTRAVNEFRSKLNEGDPTFNQGRGGNN